MKKISSVIGAAGMIAIVTLGARFMGLVRKLAQSWAMSDGVVAGTYDTANTVPNILFEVVAGGALAGAVIPLISRFLAHNLHQEESKTVSALVTWILTVSIPIAVIVMFCARFITSFLLASGSAAQIDLGTTLLQIFAWQIPLYGLSVVFSGVLQAHKRFGLPAVAPLISSTVVVGVFVWYALSVGAQTQPQDISTMAIVLLGWGTTAGVAVFSLVQLPAVMRIVKIRFSWSFPPGVARDTVRLGGAGLAGLIAQQLAILSIMYSTNDLSDPGTFAAFNYAYAVFMVPYAVLAVPIATAVFPRISQAFELHEMQKLRHLVENSTYLVLLMGATAAVLIATLATPAKGIIELGNTITGLDIALQSMAFGAIGFSLLYHGARVLYALGRPYLVIASNSIAWCAVIACLALGYVFDVHGREATLQWVGVSLSVGLTIGGVVLVGFLRHASGARIVFAYRARLARGGGVLAISGSVAWFLVPRVEIWFINLLGPGIIPSLIAASIGALVVLGPMFYIVGIDFRKKAFV